MKNATQEEINIFMEYALSCPDMLPYLSVNRWIRARKVKKDDWAGLVLTDERLSYLLHIDFDRASGLRFTIALYAKTLFAAGKAVLALKEMIRRYKPYAVDSTVAVSNVKSFAITKRLLGEPWGKEPLGCWNMLNGEFEDLFYFRKLL